MFKIKLLKDFDKLCNAELSEEEMVILTAFAEQLALPQPRDAASSPVSQHP